MIDIQYNEFGGWWVLSASDTTGVPFTYSAF
jgi:hypothetical protein